MKPAVCFFFWRGVADLLEHRPLSQAGAAGSQGSQKSGVRKVRTGWVLGPCRGRGRGLGAPRPCWCAPSTVHCASVTPSPGVHLIPLWSRPTSACRLPTAGRPLSPGQPLGLCPVACPHHPPKEPAEGPPQAWTSGLMWPLLSARSRPPSSGPLWPLHTHPGLGQRPSPARRGSACPTTVHILAA